MVDRERKDDSRAITSNELSYILDINQKAIAIHLAVEQQNESVIGALDKLAKKIDTIEKHAEETLKLTTDTEKEVKNIEKSMFKLILILSSTGVGLIIQIIQLFLHH